MSSRAVAALGLLIAASAAERFAYWGMRSFVMSDLLVAARDRPADAAQSMTSFFMGLGVLGVLFGAGLAYAVGARIAAVVALAVIALGIAGLAADLPPLAGAGLASVGSGMFRLCPCIAAVEIFAREDGADAAPSPRRFASLSAFATGIVVAINIGSMLAPAYRSVERVSRSQFYIVMAGIALFAAVLAFASILIAPSKGPQAPMPDLAPYRGGAAVPSAPLHPSPSTTVPAVAILGAAACLWWIGMSASTVPSSIGHRVSWLYSVSTAAATAASVLALVAWIVAATARWSGTPLLFYGVGLAVFGVGLGIIAIGSREALIYAFGAIIAGVGEAALPIGVAYAALSVRGRASSIVLAGWFLASTFVSRSGADLARQPELSRTVALVVLCCLCFGLGVVFVAFARKMQRAFDTPPPSPHP